MSDIQADIKVLRVFKISSTEGTKVKGKDKTKVVPVHAPKASTGNYRHRSILNLNARCRMMDPEVHSRVLYT